MKIGRWMNGSVAATIGAAIMISSLTVGFRGNSVEAAGYEKKITWLGMWGLEDPEKAEKVTDEWRGSYVYFGSYFQDSNTYKQPIKWRVLNYATNDFSQNGDRTKTVLLQSDQVLDAVQFNQTEDMKYDEYHEDYYVWYMNKMYDCNYYATSNIRKWLNSLEGWKGDYTSGGFYKTAFNQVEQNMLYPSYAETDYSGMLGNFYKTSCGLSGDDYEDYVFLLNIDEANDESYGFYPLTGNESSSASHKADATTYAVNRGAAYSDWWLRAETTDDDSRYNGYITSGGSLGTIVVNDDTTGVRPACNVDEDYIAYTSLLEGTSGEAGAVYKFTAYDKEIDLNLDYTKKGEQVDIQYTVSGNDKENATQLSYLVTATDGNQVYAYGKLADLDKDHLSGQLNLDLNMIVESVKSAGEACTLDELCQDYSIMVIAEQVHVDDPATSTIDESRLTDYASYNWTLELAEEENEDTNEPSAPAGSTEAQNQNGNTTKQKVVRRVVAQPAVPAKVGTRVKGASGAIYKVTSANPAYPEVQYVLAPAKAKGTLNIPATLTSGSIKYNITSIANEAVWKNKKIKKVVIGNNVRTIGKKAFYGCKKLKKVVFGTNVTTIGAGAFYNCKKLKTLTIPSSVKKIGKEAFRNCKGLRKVKINTLKLKKKTVGKNVFKGVPKSTKFIGKKRRKNYKSIFGL